MSDVTVYGCASGLLLLSRADVARLMNYAGYVDAVEAAFRADASGCATGLPATGIAVPQGSFHAKGAALLDDNATVAIKINGNFPGNPTTNGLPTVQGIIYLADATNGRPLALMDSIEVTINRTGAATTLAARHLARPESTVATICGAGAQGRIQARAIAAALPLRRLQVWDIRPDAAKSLAEELSRQLQIDACAIDSLAAVHDSDVVVTCTSARKAFLMSELVAPGTFIAAVGADNPDKHEIDPALFAASTIVVDSLDQCAEIGDLHHAIASGVISREDVHATLAEIVTATRPGRRDLREITLFDSTGTGLQDVAAASVIYRRALAAGVGTFVTLA